MGIQRTQKVWKNGKLVSWKDASPDIFSHGLHYGTGVFEGIRCFKTHRGPAIFRGQDHFKRFYNSAGVYFMKIPYSQSELLGAAKSVIRANNLTNCYVRPIAFFGFGELAFNPLACPVEVAVMAIKWAGYFPELKGKSVKCIVSSWRRVSNTAIPTRAKATGQYVNSILASLEAQKHGFDEAIFLNDAGLVAEGSGENVFIVKDGTLVTPPLSAGILPGITRDSLMKIAGDLSIPVEVGNISRDELYVADEAFLCGTASGIVPIREIDSRQVGAAPGSVTQKLFKKYFEIVEGRDTHYFKWLDFVD